jgi:hypothetical protein
MPQPTEPAEPTLPLPAACLNCSQALGQPRPNFCPACGQETNVKAPRIREFMQQWGGAYFATEGALWRTLKLLFFQPGELTSQYLAGRRKHYVLPLRLYLSISVIMLVLIRLSGSANFASMDDPDVADALPDRPAAVTLELGFGSAGVQDGQFYCTGLAPWICKRLQKRLDVSTKVMVQQMRIVTERVASNAGAMMFVLMPAFALGLRLLYRNRSLHYTEHLVFALHVHTFWSLVVACMLVEWEPVIWAGMFVIPSYAVLAMRHVYGGRWWPLLLRAGVLFVSHAALIAVAAVALTLVAMLL